MALGQILSIAFRAGRQKPDFLIDRNSILRKVLVDHVLASAVTGAHEIISELEWKRIDTFLVAQCQFNC